MKLRKNKKFNTIIVGLMTLLLTCCVVVGGTQVAFSANVEETQTNSTASSASGEGYYTWHRLESTKQLKELFKDERYVVANSKGEKNTIPIMIMSSHSSNGKKYVLNAPADQGTGNNILNKYGDKLWGHEANQTSNVYFSATPVQELAGFYYSDSTDTIITSDVNPFFLENTSYEQRDYPKNGLRYYVYDYQLHTYTVGDGGTVVPSANMLTIVAGDDDADKEYWCDTPILQFLEVKETPLIIQGKHYAHAWNIFEKTTGGKTTFEITTKYYGHLRRAIWDGLTWLLNRARLVEMETKISLHKNGVWLTHSGPVATQSAWGDPGDYDFGGKSWTNKDCINNGKPYAYTHSDLSDNLEIWYGVKGIETSKLKTVNGTEYFPKEQQSATTFATTTELGGKSIKGESVLSIPTLSVAHIAKGKTLTIEQGSTLILARNSVLYNDGQIINNGTIIVQPGAVLTVFNAVKNEEGTGEIILGDANGETQGDILVRSGGKIAQWNIKQNKVRSAGTIYAANSIAVSKYKSSRKGMAYTGSKGGYMAPADVIGLTISDLNQCLKAAGCLEYGTN